MRRSGTLWISHFILIQSPIPNDWLTYAIWRPFLLTYCLQVDWIYFLAFAAVVVGLIIYSVYVFYFLFGKFSDCSRKYIHGKLELRLPFTSILVFNKQARNLRMSFTVSVKKILVLHWVRPPCSWMIELTKFYIFRLGLWLYKM